MKTIGALLMAAAATLAVASSSSPSKLWAPAGTSIGTEEVTFSLSLPMQNKDKLDAFFTAVSDPKRFVCADASSWRGACPALPLFLLTAPRTEST